MKLKFTYVFLVVLSIILLLPWYPDFVAINNPKLISISGVVLLFDSAYVISTILSKFKVYSSEFIFFVVGCFGVLWNALLLLLFNTVSVLAKRDVLVKLNRYLLIFNTIITIVLAIYAIYKIIFFVLGLGFWLYLALLLFALKNVDKLNNEILSR